MAGYHSRTPCGARAWALRHVMSLHPERPTAAPSRPALLSWRGLAVALVLLATLAAAGASEGVRVAGQELPTLPGWTWLALLAAAWLGRGLFDRCSGAVTAGLMALVLGALCGLLLGHDSEAWDPPRVAVAARPLGAPEAAWREARLPLERLATPRGALEAFGRRGGLELRARGVLLVPEGGRYTLGLECEGSCRLHLDGLETSAGSPLELPAGPLRFEVELLAPERAFVRLDWDRPGWLHALAPAEACALEPRDAGAVQALERGRLLRWPLEAALQAALLLGVASLLGRGWAARTRARSALLGWLAAPLHRRALLLGAGAIVFLAGLRAWAGAHALPNGYLHAWTSEYMMQTVSTADLRSEPWRSLVFLHIQPPAFDGLRALLVARHGDLAGPQLLAAVDHDLYRAWGLAYGALVALACAWLGQLGGTRAGLLGAALLALQPAVLFYATFLDSTFVSALGVLWLTYELWRLGPGGRGSLVRTGLAVAALFLTRSIVQAPFLLVLAASLLLLGLERRRALRLLLPVALLMGLFLAKQYALFGLTITSSFGPDSFCKGLSAYCQGSTPVELPHALPPPGAAATLRTIQKLNGEYNYNQLAFLRRSFSQLVEYRALLARTPPSELALLVAHNVSLWLRPSTRHSAHVLVDRLPWRGAGDALMSGWALALMLLLAAGHWALAERSRAANLRRGLGLALPALYFAAVSIVFESGENMRYKFFVEPLLFVFLWSRAVALAQGWRGARP